MQYLKVETHRLVGALLLWNIYVSTLIKTEKDKRCCLNVTCIFHSLNHMYNVYWFLLHKLKCFHFQNIPDHVSCSWNKRHFWSHRGTELCCCALNTVLGLINKHVLTGEINNLMRPRAGVRVLLFMVVNRAQQWFIKQNNEFDFLCILTVLCSLRTSRQGNLSYLKSICEGRGGRKCLI